MSTPSHRARVSWHEKPNLPQVTLRATIAGLLIGSVVLVSNFQFGLQTGWVSMMSLPAALLGFAIFKISPFANDFSDVENVYVQSLAVSVGTGPLAYGLIGIVPAIEKLLTTEESGLGRQLTFSLPDLFIWSMGLAFFGVFFAIPLRKQVIIKEKLPFPSGSATGVLISVLHGTKILQEDSNGDEPEVSDDNSVASDILQDANDATYASNIRSLTVTFLISSFYTLSSYFVPILRNLPIFGRRAAAHMFTFQPSPAYIGQGIIMGLPTVSYMLFGAILGWGILAPLVKYMDWAPGAVDDWKTGGQGWIMWISLSIMISDSVVSFIIVISRSIHQLLVRPNTDPEAASLLHKTPSLSSNEQDSSHLLSNKFTVIGVIASSILCSVSLKVVFGDLVPLYAIVVAIVLALLFSILAVRALGETDLNPVSGIGKLSQIILAVVVPNNHKSKILINLIAGGIAEAGAQQAGDLMQDLKTGHLLGASPKAQFVAQIIGTIYSVFLSSIMYKVYNNVYHIPSKMFRIPTAVIWIDCARLVTGEGLPPKAYEFSIFFGLVFGIIAVLKNTVTANCKYHRYIKYLPSGVAVGIGIYNTPNFTFARFVGGAFAYLWTRYTSMDKNSKTKMVIISSGLVLGEGLFSAVTMLLTSMNVKHF